MTLFPFTHTGLAAESASAGKAVTGLLQHMSKTGDPIAQDCFKLLATLLRESHTYKPTNAQLQFLLTWAFGDMEEAANRQAGFGLLKVSPKGTSCLATFLQNCHDCCHVAPHKCCLASCSDQKGPLSGKMWFWLNLGRHRICWLQNHATFYMVHC